MFIPPEEERYNFLESIHSLERLLREDRTNIQDIHLRMKDLILNVQNEPEEIGTLSSRVTLVLHEVESLQESLEKSTNIFQKIIRSVGWTPSLTKDLEQFSTVIEERMKQAIHSHNFEELFTLEPLLTNIEQKVKTWKNICKEKISSDTLRRLLDYSLDQENLTVIIEIIKNENPFLAKK